MVANSIFLSLSLSRFLLLCVAEYLRMDMVLQATPSRSHTLCLVQLCLCLSLCIAMDASSTPSLCLSLSISLCLCVCVCEAIMSGLWKSIESQSPPLWMFICVSLSVHVHLCLTLCLSFFDSRCVSVSLCAEHTQLQKATSVCLSVGVCGCVCGTDTCSKSHDSCQF